MPLLSAPERLQKIVETLRQRIAQQPDGVCRVPRFDAALFHTKGTRLSDYLQELERNLHHLQQKQHSAVQQQWLAQRVLDQLAALQRECESQQLRPWREQPRRDTCQQKRVEYQGYETRLLAMLRQREAHLAQAETLSVQQQLMREVEQLQARLSRCRAALYQLDLPAAQA
ncbi:MULTISPECIES: primosomal replication protein PriC [Pantoea]|uniref:primosomal replication protein PriC n=1 Tax=Pantoea TaxID=53335 RepID=UPI00259399D5|nr:MULTISPECIES: primosomal replication protein PriC [Pantoea]